MNFSATSNIGSPVLADAEVEVVQAYDVRLPDAVQPLPEAVLPSGPRMGVAEAIMRALQPEVAIDLGEQGVVVARPFGRPSPRAVLPIAVGLAGVTVGAARAFGFGKKRIGFWMGLGIALAGAKLLSGATSAKGEA